MSYESRDRHVSSAHVPRTQQGWVVLTLTCSSSQKIISSDMFGLNQIPSLKTQLAPSQAHWVSWCHHCRTQGARKPATFCFPICLLLLQELHTSSTNTWTVGAALVSAFATAHLQAAGLRVIQGVISAHRSRAKETQKRIQQFWGAFQQLHSSLKLWEQKEVALVPKILFITN